MARAASTLLSFFTSRRTHWPLWRSYVSQGADGVPKPTGYVKQHYKGISHQLGRWTARSCTSTYLRATHVSDTKNVEGGLVSPVPGGTSIFFMHAFEVVV
jgi:hypothetical protein